MQSALEFSEVYKRYGKRTVLDGISLRLMPGEAVGLVGINGAGKTTLIRGLLDLNRIDEGRILIHGESHLEPASRRHLSYLAERFTPPPFASGFEVLRYLLSLHQVTHSREVITREAAALDLSAEALARPSREYSKGMAQKLGLLACVLSGCAVMVLDEPMSGLDPRARMLVKQRLSAMKQAGAALFFSTHLLVDVEALCDRLVVLHAGTIAFDGSADALLRQTGSADLEAAFLGLIA